MPGKACVVVPGEGRLYKLDFDDAADQERFLDDLEVGGADREATLHGTAAVHVFVCRPARRTAAVLVLLDKCRCARRGLACTGSLCMLRGRKYLLAQYLCRKSA